MGTGWVTSPHLVMSGKAKLRVMPCHHLAVEDFSSLLQFWNHFETWTTISTYISLKFWNQLKVVKWWHKNERMNKRTNKQTNEWTNEQMNERMNEQMNKQTNKRTNKRTLLLINIDVPINSIWQLIYFCFFVCLFVLSFIHSFIHSFICHHFTTFRGFQSFSEI